MMIPSAQPPLPRRATQRIATRGALTMQHAPDFVADRLDACVATPRR
jgi:hypothetical protein